MDTILRKPAESRLRDTLGSNFKTLSPALLNVHFLK